jgi:hypothetical protein
MMGLQSAPAQLFYDFCLDEHVPADHLLRRIDYFLDLDSVRSQLKPFYSTIGRPSVDPELMMRMLIIGSRSGTFPQGFCPGVELCLDFGTETPRELRPHACDLGLQFTHQRFASLFGVALAASSITTGRLKLRSSLLINFRMTRSLIASASRGLG